MPTIPLWPFALVFPLGMVLPMLGLKGRHFDPQLVMCAQSRWACYFTPGLLYLCFWDATAAAGWTGALIFLPFLALGTYMCSLMLRIDRVFHGPH